MQKLFVIVVKSNTNELLPKWLPGSPVRCADHTFSGGPSFDLALSWRIEAFSDRGDAVTALAQRQGAFRGVTFEIREFRAE